MHTALKQEVQNLKDLALRKGVPLTFAETTLDTVAFVLTNKKLVCLTLVEDEIHNMLTCYKVDINKWNWAELEGFTTEEEFPKIANEILIKFNTPKEYLRYLGL